MKKKSKTKQFTLIELIIVIVVIGVLAGMALPKFIGTTKDAKVSAMDQDLDVLEKAVQLYESDNDGAEPFLKDGSGNYAKVNIARQTLKDTLDAIGDDESSVYTLNMEDLKPYLERLKYTDSTTNTYLYSTKTRVAINEQGKIDSSGIAHHILGGGISTSTSTTSEKTLKMRLMGNSASSTTSFVIGDDGELYAWGDNRCGQLGDGTNKFKTTPTKITLASGVKPTQIACGGYHSMAIGDDGNLYTWGDNDCGQLGDGTTDEKDSPTKITLSNGVKPTQIVCGTWSSMAIGDDGELYTWGNNYNGQLGNGTHDNNNHSAPTKIILAGGVKPKQISCGDSFSMVIGDDNNLYTWGDNENGQLGDNATLNKSTPEKIALPNGVKPTQITCGNNHSLAIGSDGELYIWGHNNSGQLGIGTYDYDKHSTPIKITLASGVKPTQISAGYNFSMATGDDGELYTWGDHAYRKLGDGTRNEIYVPTKFTLADGVTSSEFVNGEISKFGVANGVKPTQISCGMYISMIIDTNDKLYVFGTNQLGE